MAETHMILTIDDEEPIRRSIRVFFEDSGFEVVEAADGQKGLDLFRSRRPSVVLVDLRMPGISGAEVIDTLKREAPEVPVIVLSGTGLIADAIDAMRRGAWDYVTKPITDMSELEHVVRIALERSRLMEENRRYREHLEEEVERRTKELKQEIDERKRTEERLLLSEQSLKDILQASPIGIGKAKNRVFDWVNETMCKITGYSLEEIQGKTARLLYENGQEFGRVGETLSKEKAVETKWVRKDGDVRDILLHVTHTSDEAYIFTAIDFTEQKNLEGRLRQAQKMEAIGTLAGGIAHDFNNILTAMMGYATLVQMKVDTSNPLRPYVDQLILASRKAANLTQSLLAFSRQQPAQLAPLDINETIKATGKLLKRLLTEDIELHTLFSEENTTVMADKTQMDQILFNLVTNARDSMPRGGTLTIETDLVEIYDSTFIGDHGFERPGRYVQVKVSDTGIGMDEATREKIFDPFFTTKETGKGTGLGLATVYGIVKQCSGYITVESKLGQGSIFRIYLPSVRRRADKEHVAPVTVKTGSETILVAEDNEEVRSFMREALKGCGYRIIEAMDGEDAVETFKQHQDADLIIVDSVMPKKNGREVYEEIHKIKPGIKALFTSGYTRDIILDKGIEDKEFNFIAKPLVLNDFLQKVRDILDGR